MPGRMAGFVLWLIIMLAISALYDHKAAILMLRVLPPSPVGAGSGVFPMEFGHPRKICAAIPVRVKPQNTKADRVDLG